MRALQRRVVSPRETAGILDRPVATANHAVMRLKAGAYQTLWMSGSRPDQSLKENCMRLSCSILAAFLICNAAHASDEVRSIPLAMAVSPDAVTASGRWVTGQSLDVPLIARANTADIRCTRSTMTCTEALASLVTSEDHPEMAGQLLLSVFSHYVVESWTETEIVAKADKDVADLTLSIDLVARSASRRHQETRTRGNQSADPDFRVDWQLR